MKYPVIKIKYRQLGEDNRKAVDDHVTHVDLAIISVQDRDVEQAEHTLTKSSASLGECMWLPLPKLVPRQAVVDIPANGSCMLVSKIQFSNLLSKH